MPTIQTLESATLYEDKDKLWLDLTYIFEDDVSKKRVRIPKVRLPLEGADISLQGYPLEPHSNKLTINIFDNQLYAYPRKVPEHPSEGLCFEQVLEEKQVEMTLSEIEEKLGHKIKIVKEKK